MAAACGDNLDANAIDANNNNNNNGDAADSDGAVAIDAPNGGIDAAVGVMCDTDFCTAGEECCIQGMNRSCVATGTCNGTNFDCDGIEDCAGAGMVCCFSGAGGPGGGSTCTDAASCPTPTCAGAGDCTMAPNTMCCTVGQLQVCLAACPP
jgi:hypothetical protein